MGLFSRREIEPIEVGGKTRYEVQGDPSGQVYNTPEEAASARNMLDAFRPINNGNRDS